MVGMLARSLCGHDKSELYVIVKEDTEYVYLCDGKYKPLEKPKRKNKKHIQVIKKFPQSSFVQEKMKQGNLKNEEIKRTIKEYILES